LDATPVLLGQELGLDQIEAGVAGPLKEFVGLESEPQVATGIAGPLVVVTAQFDDAERAVGAQQVPDPAKERLRGRLVMQHQTRHEQVVAAPCRQTGEIRVFQAHAARIQRFYQQHINPYLNFHRPCAQPELSSDAKGKQKRIYRHYQTPWETFQKLPKASQYLKPGQTVGALQRLAKAASDTAAARQMQQAKGKLFASFVGAKTAP
jgi:hypothetical protein